MVQTFFLPAYFLFVNVVCFLPTNRYIQCFVLVSFDQFFNTYRPKEAWAVVQTDKIFIKWGDTLPLIKQFKRVISNFDIFIVHPKFERIAILKD